MDKLIEYIFVYQIEIQIVSIAVFLSGMFSALLLMARKIYKMQIIQINDIDDVTSFNSLIDEEIGMLKRENYELAQLLNEKSNRENCTSDTKLFNNAPYTQAVQLAKRGYARNDIISLCSLTESEADLIFALHSKTEAA